MPARLVPLAVGRTAGAVSGLAECGIMLRLTRGRLWIGALATLLVGIVALNVVALSFNASSSKDGRKTYVLERQNSTLRAQIAAAGVSNERIQELAARFGMVVPEPGDIAYLDASPKDAQLAAQRLASGEVTAGTPSTSIATTAPITTTVAPAPTVATTEPVAATVPPPVESAPPVTTTPAPEAPPAPTTTEPSTAPTDTVSSGTPSTGGGTSTGAVSP